MCVHVLLNDFDSMLLSSLEIKNKNMHHFLGDKTHVDLGNPGGAHLSCI